MHDSMLYKINVNETSTDAIASSSTGPIDSANNEKLAKLLRIDIISDIDSDIGDF